VPTPHEAIVRFATHASKLGALVVDRALGTCVSPASEPAKRIAAHLAEHGSAHTKALDLAVAGTPLRVILAEPDWLDSPSLHGASRALGESVWTLRSAMMHYAVFTPAAARVASASLTALAGDLSCESRAESDHEATLASFTDELTKTYETLSLLYTIGSGLTDLAHPDRFLRAAADRLQTGSDFRHIAVRHPAIEGPGASAADDPIILSSRDPERADAFLDVVRGLTSDHARFADGKRVVPPASPLTRHDRQVLVQPLLLDGTFHGYLVGTDKGGTDPMLSSYDLQLFQSTASFLAAFLQTCRLFEQQRQMFLGTIKALTASIDAKDRYTRGHSERVAWLSAALARALGRSEAECRRIHIAGLVHDVGKIGVPEAVLCKPGRLTDDEFAWIKKHPTIGHTILSGIPLLADILPGVLHHHERIDGKGYPAGLAGDAIPLMARIIAVADTFDALSSTRSYRAARPRDVVLAEIARSAGTQLDPAVAAALASVDLTEFDRMLNEHATSAPAAIVAAA
jgi:HD-GYP domain-containing protein (c-di-GMP phosphodiesterase class II)